MRNLIALFLLCFIMNVSSAFAGNVTGAILFEGEEPILDELSMGADPTCLMAHDDEVLSQEVIVNGNGTLKNVFVYVKEGVTGSFETPAEVVEFNQIGCVYVPHVLGVMVGQEFEIINSDSTLHNVHAVATNNKEFNLGMPIQGMKLKKTFSEPEIMVKVKCDVHPWMGAYIGVLSHPFYSVSDGEGNFEIKDLPDGEYVLEAWHEIFGTQTAELTVSGGESSPIEFKYS